MIASFMAFPRSFYTATPSLSFISAEHVGCKLGRIQVSTELLFL